MKQIKISFFPIVVAVGLTLSLGACHNDDTNPSPYETDTSSAATEMPAEHSTTPDTTNIKIAAPADTSMTKSSNNTVKPNPAKKGLKGKVTIMEGRKMTGAMEADNTGVYSNVEIYPSFPGGTKGLQDFFDKNLNYPEDASNQGVEGTVDVMFTVDETGKLTNPHIMGDQAGYGLDAEALRVVKTMPAWNPGKLKGRNVKTNFTLPVNFRLN